MKKSSFEIINSSGNEMQIVHEPECFEFILQPDEEISVEVDSIENSVALRCSIESGICVISILSNKSLYRVLHKGVDVFKKYM